MNKYLVLEIENLQPLKIGSRGVQNHIENSKTFIPGSTIRGAIIYYLIKQLKLDKNLCVNGEDKYRKQLLEDMKCYNAYPVYKDKLFFPSPMHLRTDKHKFREASGEKKEDFQNFGSLLNGTEYKNTLPLSYISLDDSIIRSIEVTKEFRLHHNKGESQDNLFRYEAIKRGHIYRTIIKGSQVMLTAIREALKNNHKWYLGGSKGSGYGLCDIKGLCMCDTYEEAKKELGLKLNSQGENTLVITCLSDCIFRDENGNPSNHIPESELEQIVGKKKFELVRVIIEQGYSEGYNATWGLRYPKESTVKAGSILKYSCDHLNTEDLLKIEKKLYGMRTTDGYGWIAANVEYPTKIDLRIMTANSKPEKKKTQIPSNDMDSLRIILKGLKKAKEKWLRHIFVKEENSCIKVNIDENSIKQNMIKILKYEIEPNDTILNRSNLNNRSKFSIKEHSFRDIYDYCLKKKDKPILDHYIDNKLNSLKGSLFYKDIGEDKREFLKDLTILSLELGGKNNE